MTLQEIYAALRRGVCPNCKDEDGGEISLEPHDEEYGGPFCSECDLVAWDAMTCYGIRPKLCARCDGDGRTFNELERELERCDECGGCGLVVDGIEVAQ